MATATQALAQTERPETPLGALRASFVDRWIYVFTASSIVLVTLLGFVPDSLQKIAAVRSGQRPPFPIVLHMHAVLMGTFLLLLLAQTILVALGRSNWHRRLGMAGMVVGPALVVVGFVLVPTTYHWLWKVAQTAPPLARPAVEQIVRFLETIMLGQLGAGLLFSLLLFIGLAARRANPGLHKRLMILAITPALGAAFDRMTWLPTMMRGPLLTSDLYPMLVVSPMLTWDLIRNGRLHMAYWVWLAGYIPLAVATYGLSDTPWWHAVARRLMGV